MGDRSGNSRAASFLSFFAVDHFSLSHSEVAVDLDTISSDSVGAKFIYEVGSDVSFAAIFRQVAIDTVSNSPFFALLTVDFCFSFILN